MIKLADKFNNPVPDGTAAILTTEFGRIQGSCITRAVTVACPGPAKIPEHQQRLSSTQRPSPSMKILIRQRPTDTTAPLTLRIMGPAPMISPVLRSTRLAHREADAAPSP